MKRGWWKGVRNGDVLLFTASAVLVNVLYEAQPKAVRGALVRKGFGVLRGDGWVDRAAVESEDAGDVLEGKDQREDGPEEVKKKE